MAYSKQVDVQNQLSYCYKAVEMLKRIFEFKDNPDLATSMINLAHAYGRIGDLNSEIELLYKALEMRKRVFQGIRNSEVASSLFELGCAYERRGGYKKELEYKLEALEIVKSLKKKDHNTVKLLSSLGGVSAKLGDSNNEIKYKLEALEVCENLSDVFESEIVLCLSGMADCYAKRGNYAQRLKYLNRLKDYVASLNLLKSFQIYLSIFYCQLNVLIDRFRNIFVASFRIFVTP